MSAEVEGQVEFIPECVRELTFVSIEPVHPSRAVGGAGNHAWLAPSSWNNGQSRLQPGIRGKLGLERDSNMTGDEETEAVERAASPRHREPVTAAPTDHQPPPERTNFALLTLGNPNYFGNLTDSPFPPVTSVIGNTTYEEVRCVGYNPDVNLLKAVVWIKLPFGFLGDLCAPGSKEYVRFYISFDNGATWQDQGLVSFTAHDTPGPKPLEYAVTLAPHSYHTWCTRELLPLVRAILSWNVPPPPNTPNYSPVWGNMLDGHIQVQPWQLFSVADLLNEANLKLPAPLQALIDPKAELKAPPAAPLSVAELLALYHQKGVHQHRFLFPKIQPYLADPAAFAAYAEYGSDGPLTAVGANLAEIIAEILKTDGDTSYEQLHCIGLDPNAAENLVGTLTIKRPLGYSGAQCAAGSEEYLAFWVDWQDGTGWHWVGTAQVKVHDFHTIPPDGLQYAVTQPINLAPRRKPCQDGPVIAHVRAILSWAVPPPPGNPNFVPTWGNRLETYIEIAPGTPIQTGDYTPYIESVCFIDICDVDPATGLAPGERPFGGSVSIFGIIPGAPAVTTPEANRPKYRVQVSPSGTNAWQPINDSFSITLHEQILPGLPTATAHLQTADPGGYFTYQVAPNVPGVGWRDIVPSGLLAVWNTAGKTGKWDIMIDAYNPIGPVHYPAGGTFCAKDGTIRAQVTIDLDNAAPITSLQITGYSRGGGPVQPAADCQTFEQGDIIHGTYSVFDEHFGSLALVVEPSGPANGATVTPSSRSYPTVPNTGESGTWTLDTSKMEPCGYTIQLQTNDRTWVNCVEPWRNDSAFVGFCLVAKP
jgi:hypothetical protein